MTRLVAHRGASALEPEHSRAAYERALADGADGLECDVRLTADGVAVCWHDATLDRTSDGRGPVHEATLAQVRALALRGPGGDARGALTLRELLGLALGAGRPLTVAIELKHPAPYGWAAEDAVLAELDALGWDPASGALGDLRISLMSFHPGALAHLARRVPAAHLMVLLDDAPGADPDLGSAADVAEAWRLADAGIVGGVGPGLGVVRRRPERVAAWLAAGRLVRVWTVNAAGDAAACLALGVPELTTDDPGGLRAALSAAP
ncbi:glycerophosphodiester phosphodiesterase [Actinotalea solisilvae]|uniref:glycerophosphodiester phosphodiesterase n=1 Tax=Actinotalea solisilvae TaxID=2072922 RepID=UPI0018F1CED3|nr:glycerophosphodiester phosphodiesterase family protein [Actinotalea solisilvae]